MTLRGDDRGDRYRVSLRMEGNLREPGSLAEARGAGCWEVRRVRRAPDVCRGPTKSLVEPCSAQAWGARPRAGTSPENGKSGKSRAVGTECYRDSTRWNLADKLPVDLEGGDPFCIPVPQHFYRRGQDRVGWQRRSIYMIQGRYHRGDTLRAGHLSFSKKGNSYSAVGECAYS